jgi:hypothetical protein
VTAPGWYALLLIALAAMRTTRLAGWDTISAGLRRRVTGWTDDGTWTRPTAPRAARIGSAMQAWLHCPWCAGAWHAAGWWAAWSAWPGGTLVVAAPFAISMIVGLVVANLDT